MPQDQTRAKTGKPSGIDCPYQKTCVRWLDVINVINTSYARFGMVRLDRPDADRMYHAQLTSPDVGPDAPRHAQQGNEIFGKA